MKNALALAALEALGAALVPLALGTTQPWPGSLDHSFGNGGVVATEAQLPDDPCEADAAVLQPDGKVVTAVTRTP